MKKEEILQKSRLENKNGDERQHFLAEQSYTISFAILAAVLLVISILSPYNFITGTIHIAKASYTLYEFTLFLLLIFGIVFGISRFLLLKNKYSLIWVFICLVGFFMLFCGVYGYAG